MQGSSCAPNRTFLRHDGFTQRDTGVRLTDSSELLLFVCFEWLVGVVIDWLWLLDLSNFVFGHFYETLADELVTVAQVRFGHHFPNDFLALAAKEVWRLRCQVVKVALDPARVLFRVHRLRVTWKLGWGKHGSATVLTVKLEFHFLCWWLLRHVRKFAKVVQAFALTSLIVALASETQLSVILNSLVHLVSVLFGHYSEAIVKVCWSSDHLVSRILLLRWMDRRIPVRARNRPPISYTRYLLSNLLQIYLYRLVGLVKIGCCVDSLNLVHLFVMGAQRALTLHLLLDF